MKRRRTAKNIEDRNRHKPYEGRTVTVEWSSNPFKANERVEHAEVISAGLYTLWLHAPAQGVKEEQEFCIKYASIKSIRDEGVE